MIAFLTPKLGRCIAGGLVALLVIGALWARGSHYKGQRDDLQAWQGEVTQAARDAAHRPKLAVKNVAQQVRYLGKGIDDFRLAMATAKATALANKLAADRRNEDRRKDSDHALDQAIPEYRRRTDDYARAHGVRGKSGPSSGDRSDNGGRDLPGPAFGAEEPDGAGEETGLVAIPRADLDICTANTLRLENAVEWAKALSEGPR